MNKTVNINLAGIFFHIDEDAYLKLSRYLEAIKRSFTDSQGRSEIISDIEARIAELFSERIQNEKQVVGTSLVDQVITIMGQPEDYLVDDEIFEDEPTYTKQRQTKSGPSKKLYRDTDNSYIGGVASGLSHYFGIEVLWIRLIWVVLIFGAGTGVIIYLLLWVLVPEAKTTAEKLTMTGEPVNISNIEKKIKDGIDVVSEKVKNVDFKKHGDTIKEGFENVADNISETVKSVNFDKQGDRLKNKSRNFFETIGDIVMFFLKVFAKFFGVIMIITGISVLLTLLVTLFTLGSADTYFPGMNFIEATNVANTPIWLASLLTFFAVGVPFFFLFYLGLKILINNLKSIGNPAKFTLLGLWIIAILGLIVTGVRQASEYAFDGEFVSKNELKVTSNDTLKISMTGFDNYNNYYYRNHNNFRLTEDENGRNIVSQDIKLIVYSTTDSVGKITVVKEARGSSYGIARKRAEQINYNYSFSNNELKLDAYHTTDIKNKYSEQEVRVIVYLPEGTVLFNDRNTRRYQRRWYNNYNSIISDAKDEHYLRVIRNGVECLDCPVEINTDNDETTSLEKNPEKGIIIESGDSIKLKLDSEGIKGNTPNIEVKIDNESGVEIKSKTNDN